MLRLKSATDFERVRRDGRSHAHPLAVLIACANGAAHTRWGFAAGKSVGTAVERNRAKRLLREAARARQAEAAPGWDLIFIARRPLAAAKLAQAEAVMRSLLQRAKVIPSENV
jgi:ribonuclease P protein component